MTHNVIAALNAVSRYYGKGESQVRAVDRISLELGYGDMKVLVGPSGSGKSSLLHLLGCIDKPDEGKVIIDGIDTTSMTLEQLAPLRLRKIGFVFQSFNLIPVLTAYENVEIPLLFNGHDKSFVSDRVNTVLDMVGLVDRKHHYPRHMSGGQQQRVAIARALVARPVLIIADEPTANLDSITGTGILELLMELNAQEGVTVILSSHDSVVLDRISSVIPVKDGRIIDGAGS
ncbi:lipoprotein-releasing system ATP-binding protein LolD [Prosthecochloris sp. ZM]|uniref:ABC transporter ATP-binding protein n=1 Tax=Prosthecochloris sp. ZM TaxID=2283143 RepID=UPI000DF80EED|nr:ABC transporter ATP-binding protein [Prosthecochloris sp. ZM]RDD30364.1 lipoprotein-releasing system ATP-binding protein LolD [Prosthecochloris sp. ZM]